jgi:molecular chaperone GrpE
MGWLLGRKTESPESLPPPDASSASLPPGSLPARESPAPNLPGDLVSPTVGDGQPEASLVEASASEPQQAAPSDPTPSVPTANNPEFVRPALDELFAIQKRQAEELARLRELFESRLRSDDVQNRSLDRLLDELRDYKANFVRQQWQPLLREVIDCHDFTAKESQRLAAEESTSSEASASLGVLRQMLLDLLSRYDIEPYRHESELFDAKWQQCIKTVLSSNPEDDKRIAEQGVPGFRQGEQLVRREQVVVYKFKSGS